MATYKDMAELIFPDVKLTLKELEKRYPKRDLPEGAEVTRFAPSPTGFLHTGSLFTAMVAWKIAKQSKGVYFFRLEDTDQKREVEGTGKDLVYQLSKFGIVADEGYNGDGEEGIYGPYVQSKRRDIYRVVIKEMMKKGRAYPDFCTKEELDQLRLVQEANKVVPGYYGEYAKYRNLPIEEAIQYIREGKPYVIRFKSEGDHTKHFKAHDMIRGDMDLVENDQDIVILKGDGLPTYHFAHLCDDHFMHTTVVTRGEEWISSLPIHLELFAAMGWEAPKYAHLPVIMVTDKDTGNKRKLSKRKDPEAAVSYFLKAGYPKDGFIEYLMTIANSNFEAWMMENPKAPVSDFALSFGKFSLDGALFDVPKLENICKEYLSHLDKKEITLQAEEWAKEYDPKLLGYIQSDREKFEKIMDIERPIERPRKDYTKFSDIVPHIAFFYKEDYEAMLSKAPLPFNPNIDADTIASFLSAFTSTLDLGKDEDTWFAATKELGTKYGFSADRKEYKKNPTAFKGWYADAISLIRIAVCCSAQSPKIYDVLVILGKEEVGRRISLALKKISK